MTIFFFCRIEKFEAQNLPVIFTQHGHVLKEDSYAEIVKWWGENGSIVRYSPAWQLMTELNSYAQPGKPNIVRIQDKNRYDSFVNTNLASILHEKNVKKLIITGTMTNLCCETTARSAFNQDFYVYFPADLNATINDEMQAATILNLQYGFAQITDFKSIMEAVENLRI
ncbi:Isochorismatase-like protein [Lipomyces japonicus]|uniref:Isochorismatase-like protein n=1 Tax=Lipomyces japonicus TaxID=56871 RepID=UPI0034CDF632